MKSCRFLAYCIMSLLVSACASTKVTSFSDPSFKGKKFQNFVIHVPNADIEGQALIATKACGYLISSGVACVSSLDVFPPTRVFSNEEKAEILRSKNVDGYLVVVIGGGSSSSQYMGSQYYGSVNVYGNFANASATSVPMYSYSRQQGFDLILIDTSTRQNAWVGGARTSGQGLLNVTDEAFASSLGRELASALKQAGHI